MNERFFENLRCPDCEEPLAVKKLSEGKKKDVIEGNLTCMKCKEIFPIKNGVPRFVPLENYASSFGMQWNMFSETQLDSVNGSKISADRFFGQTQWPTKMKGQKILEAGCGMGRFSEIALNTGADVYSLDYSTAVDAARNNMKGNPNHALMQASIYEMPFPKAYFDKIFCFGVLQHTPDVEKTFKSLVPYLKPGGSLVIDVYAAPVSWLHPRQIFRPLTKRMNRKVLYKMVEKAVPPLLKVSDAVAAIPGIGPVARFAVPVANYKGRYTLTKKQIKEWAILDTFDWFSPRYEMPQRAATIKRWFEECGLKDIHIERNVGIYVARGTGGEVKS
ncbi:MAG: methyltransferase domain-containing protein [Candidatus Peregrinibacteria bacterium]|nr:methyltransferase domain-containing protein [Candidatus Peregrinibacteria bacterium]